MPFDPKRFSARFVVDSASDSDSDSDGSSTDAARDDAADVARLEPTSGGDVVAPAEAPPTLDAAQSSTSDEPAPTPSSSGCEDASAGADGAPSNSIDDEQAKAADDPSPAVAGSAAPCGPVDEPEQERNDSCRCESVDDDPAAAGTDVRDDDVEETPSQMAPRSTSCDDGVATPQSGVDQRTATPEAAEHANPPASAEEPAPAMLADAHEVSTVSEESSDPSFASASASAAIGHGQCDDGQVITPSATPVCPRTPRSGCATALVRYATAHDRLYQQGLQRVRQRRAHAQQWDEERTVRELENEAAELTFRPVVSDGLPSRAQFTRPLDAHNPKWLAAQIQRQQRHEDPSGPWLSASAKKDRAARERRYAVGSAPGGFMRPTKSQNQKIVQKSGRDVDEATKREHAFRVPR